MKSSRVDESSSPARIHGFFLGGKDHFACDRAAAAAMVRAAPGLRSSCVAGRRFLTRVVHHAAAERGIRQFLDIGSGLPCVRNVHDLAQQIAPQTRVVYVDHDPNVVAYGQALLRCNRPGVAACRWGDVRRPTEILRSVEDRSDDRDGLDLATPVAVLLVDVLHVIADDLEAREVVRTLMDACAPGSLLAVAALASDHAPDEVAAVLAQHHARGWPATARSAERIGVLFDGLQLLDPGVVPVNQWRAGPLDHTLRDRQVLLTGGVAVKP